jgi:hypothetical protein
MNWQKAVHHGLHAREKMALDGPWRIVLRTNEANYGLPAVPRPRRETEQTDPWSVDAATPRPLRNSGTSRRRPSTAREARDVVSVLFMATRESVPAMRMLR